VFVVSKFVTRTYSEPNVQLILPETSRLQIYQTPLLYHGSLGWGNVGGYRNKRHLKPKTIVNSRKRCR